jgi:hypothetical protein
MPATGLAFDGSFGEFRTLISIVCNKIFTAGVKTSMSRPATSCSKPISPDVSAMVQHGFNVTRKEREIL